MARQLIATISLIFAIFLIAAAEGEAGTQLLAAGGGGFFVAVAVMALRDVMWVFVELGFRAFDAEWEQQLRRNAALRAVQP